MFYALQIKEADLTQLRCTVLPGNQPKIGNNLIDEDRPKHKYKGKDGWLVCMSPWWFALLRFAFSIDLPFRWAHKAML